MSGAEQAVPPLLLDQMSAVTQNQDEHTPSAPTMTITTAMESSQITADVPYSVYTINQKRCIILAASLAGFFSPLSSSIYSPVLSTIASDLAVSNSEINLTVTTYMIVQGLAPMMISGFSDTAGRRPAYLICFTIYLAANLGLSLQNNYAALMVLRCLQSAGSSGTVALANGVVGDLVPSAERGQFIAFASLGSVLGPTVSPILGGILSTYLGWHWIFWFLLIFSGAFVVPFFLFLPETCRNIVDDGQIPPPLPNWSLTDFIRHRRREKAGQTYDTAKRDQLRRNNKRSFPNPLSSLVVFKDKETIMILIATGLTFGGTFTVSTGASALFTTTYHYDDIQVALLFIPLGAGSLLSAFTTGRLVDLNFRRHAIRLNFPLVRNRKQDISKFPIEQARLEIAIPMIYLSAISLIIYGWILDRRSSIAGPVVMLFVIGYALTAAFQVLNVLMVDIYPGKPAAVTAASNLVRCEIGAGAAAIISPLIRAVGDGWAYTIVALATSAGTLCLMLTMRYGMRWRQGAIAKNEKRNGP